ncbi:MAG: hypothetical protein NC918_06635 [Candidatus Omnitrophica bacterium]|nr:hypothetical protein [Candidatus Omnitrophota bacterium]
MKKKDYDKLNILVLHWLKDPAEAQDFLLKLVYFLKKYKPEHNYIYHDISLPIPEYIKDLNFDAVILDVTLLCLRYPCHKKHFKYFIENFSFIKYLNALKIALPQDDYDCSKILDDWMVDWKVDYLFSPLAENQDINLIYKNYSQIGKINLSYTGYIDDDFFHLLNRAKQFNNRNIDICYRARKLPPYFGWIGELKWRIADIFKEKAKSFNLKLDISYHDKDTIIGKKWYDFLGDSKFTLGSLSGSSLIDPVGEIQENVKNYCAKNPNYSYEEVERLFFPGEDKYNFTAISPRNIEAAFTLTGQILIEGPYSGIMKPWEHYIPLKKDCSNFYEVLKAIQDKDYIRKMIKNCYENLLDCKKLYYSNFAQNLIDIIMEHKRTTLRDIESFEKKILLYNDEMRKKYKKLFMKRRTIKKIKNLIINFPTIHKIAKRIYNKLS